MSDARPLWRCISPRLVLLAAILGVLVSVGEAQTLNVLHSFTGGADGQNPDTDLIRDPQGNLYSATLYGGDYGYGSVFKVTPTGTKTVFYSFSGGTDGAFPNWDLLRDPMGNLYGTTYWGGSSGYGTVFKVTPTGTETVLYNFAGNSDGANPSAGLARDPQGNLYGTTYSGGASGYGTVFKVAPTGTETVLYSFTGGSDGANPTWGLIRDPQGNLYGTTYSGGASGYGTVFKVTPTGTKTVLYSFAGGSDDGAHPEAGLIRDPMGNLYGTTGSGGGSNQGTVFKVTQTGTETVLYIFSGGADGANPSAPLTRDPQGNLYGTTHSGGAYGYGTVFKVTPTGTETVLYSFTGGADGANPIGGLARDPMGNLYGTAYSGGASGYGTVFKLIP
ncbi:MAG: choice-of-anchor tandem repeat GloVer-containing protein [Chlamydiota bacterium]